MYTHPGFTGFYDETDLPFFTVYYLFRHIRRERMTNNKTGT